VLKQTLRYRSHQGRRRLVNGRRGQTYAVGREIIRQGPGHGRSASFKKRTPFQQGVSDLSQAGAWSCDLRIANGLYTAPPLEGLKAFAAIMHGWDFRTVSGKRKFRHDERLGPLRIRSRDILGAGLPPHDATNPWAMLWTWFPPTISDRTALWRAISKSAWRQSRRAKTFCPGQYDRYVTTG